jgi:hypothetical protein
MPKSRFMEKVGERNNTTPLENIQYHVLSGGNIE